MCSVLTGYLGEEIANGFVHQGATFANQIDVDSCTLGAKPHCREHKPLKSRQVLTATNSPTDSETDRTNTLSLVTYEQYLLLECCLGILSATAGSPNLKIPDPAKFHACLDACLQERIQDRPSEGGRSKSRGEGSSVATSTPAAGTPSRSSKKPTKKRSRASDDDEDESGRGGRGGGQGREANAQYACPFYIFDKHEHFSCRDAVLRGVADVVHHIRRKHEAPAFSCSRCWDVFESHDQLVAHTHPPTRCSKRPFPHHWARQEDLNNISQARIPGRRPDQTWFNIYHAIFSNDLRRQPIFPTAFAQDVVDLLSDFRNSPYYQHLAYPTGNIHLHLAWQSVSESLVRYLREGEQFARLSAQAHLAVQQTASSQTAQADFSGADTESPSAGHWSSEAFHPSLSSQGAAESSGQDFAGRNLFQPQLPQAVPPLQMYSSVPRPQAARQGMLINPERDPYMGYDGAPASPSDFESHHL